MIRERDGLAGTPAREVALDCVEAGIEAAHPRNVIRASVSLTDDTLRVAEAAYDLTDYEEVIVLGGGKAAGTVAAELESVLGERLEGGVVVTDDPVPTERVEVLEGDHPVPSERGVEGARRVLDLAEGAEGGTLLIAVLTGGGSALLPAPAEGVALSNLQAVTDALLESGADIHDINAVRKHLSAIKGGGLARVAAPATVVGLLLSDVVGDDRSVIASGPTASDDSTYADAIDVLERHGIDPPDAVAERLRRGVDGDLPETPDAGDPVFDRVENHVLANGFTALSAARDAAEGRGYPALILTSRLRGEARDVAEVLLAVAEEAHATGNPVDPPAVVLSGGETTVTVHGDGEGGPNQELALAAALELPPEAVLAAVDTDGRDGGTDAAGAIVDAETVGFADAARDALAGNDVYAYLSARDALIRTGRTGTNVNDIHALVIG